MPISWVRKFRWKTGIVVAVAAFVVSWAYYSYVSGVSAQLSPTSTVQDYRNASKRSQSQWLAQMCVDGACLAAADWPCGFSFTSARPEDFGSAAVREVLDSDRRRVRDCFDQLAAKAPVTDTLDKLRVLCGRRHMIFIGDRDYKPDDCKKAGGEWGKRLPLFSDEDKYFGK